MTVSVPDMLERLGVRVTSKRGARLWAECPHPEHDDADPSWYIIDDPTDADHGKHHCFGCGFGGWPVHLASAVLELSHREARRWLANGAAAPAPTSIRVESLPTGRRRFRLPAGVRFGPLSDWPSPPRRYAQERGLTPGQVSRWGVGYGEAGRLSGRLVFPVLDAGGQVVSYVGRSFVAAARRYLTPDRKEGPDPSAVWGECWWPPPGQRRTVAVTEGILDGLAAERWSPHSVGAVLGSEPTPGQVGKLSTFDLVVLATDGDRAGEELADKLSAMLRRWCRVARSPIPRGEDCASLAVRAGRELAVLLSSGLDEPADRDRVDVPP